MDFQKICDNNYYKIKNCISMCAFNRIKSHYKCAFFTRDFQSTFFLFYSQCTYQRRARNETIIKEMAKSHVVLLMNKLIYYIRVTQNKNICHYCLTRAHVLCYVII